MEFLEYKQKLVDSTKPTIILLKYANVKEQGKFPLVVTNTYNVTNIHIKKEMPDINDFIKRMMVILHHPMFPDPDTLKANVKRMSPDAYTDSTVKYLAEGDLFLN
ncbi:hypothetical protein RYX36_023580 [Vicia faba]